jgi:hypothetical protein
MTVGEEVAEKERELKLLEAEIARHRAHRLTWPLYVFVLSLLIGLLSLKW